MSISADDAKQEPDDPPVLMAVHCTIHANIMELMEWN